jgi:hypothetical protein
MSTTKKNIKVRDLKPSKDAKGGGATRNSSSTEGVSRNSLGLNSRGTEGAGRNSKTHQHHHGHGSN